MLMLCFVVAAALLATSSSQFVSNQGRLLSVLNGNIGRQRQVIVGRQLIADESPKPYQFGYNILNEDGSTHQRQEVQDANGNIQGSYSYTDANGIHRHVEYFTLPNGGTGQRIVTNEPGTETSQPADVVIDSNPVQVVEHRVAPIRVVEPQQVLLRRQPVQFVQRPRFVLGRRPLTEQILTPLASEQEEGFAQPDQE